MRAIIFTAVALGLSGCAGLGAFLNALPPPTPQEECQDGGGHWKTITTYDASGNATGTSGECIQGSPRRK